MSRMIVIRRQPTVPTVFEGDLPWKAYLNGQILFQSRSFENILEVINKRDTVESIIRLLNEVNRKRRLR